MAGYYDYVLGLIPAALIGVTAFLSLFGLSVTAALPAGAVVAGALVVHALFVRSPVARSVGDDPRGRSGRLVGGSAGRSSDGSDGRSRSGEAAD
ncbi:hypothetical protein [Halorubrum sp. HHNYT27]|uniref:hypothetical protein n=1 Tax=Halorubrum sp. HHNYT27 TaxID=3402275 RepID=UPI003EB7327D